MVMEPWSLSTPVLHLQQPPRLLAAAGTRPRVWSGSQSSRVAKEVVGVLLLVGGGQVFQASVYSKRSALFIVTCDDPARAIASIPGFSIAIVAKLACLDGAIATAIVACVDAARSGRARIASLNATPR